MAFKDKLRRIRTERGLKQYELASVLSYGYTAISNYESGRNQPSIEDLIRIADYFNISMDYLVDRDFENGKHPGKEVKKEVIEKIINMLKSMEYEESLFK